MARDYAQIRTDIWADDHWRTLTPGAQWLYMHLLTAPSLTHAGVADWRPTRIAHLAGHLTAADVRKYAAELEGQRFIVTDDDTEEVLIRSFLRHDGLLQNPNLWKSLGASFGDVYSPALKAGIAREAIRLRDENPTGYVSKGGRVVNPWESPALRTLMKSGSDTPIGTPSHTPIGTPSDTHYPSGSDTPIDRGPHPTPTPTPTPNASHSDDKRRRETALPKTWAPTAEHIRRGKETGVNVTDEAESFRLHAETHDRRAANWNAAFTTWLKKAKPAPASRRPGVPKNDEWMYR